MYVLALKSFAIEELNATLSAVDAEKSVATDELNVPPTDATLALKDAISANDELNLLSTEVEYCVTFPIPSIEPLNPADELIEPVTSNPVSIDTPFTPLIVIVCKLSSIFT